MTDYAVVILADMAKLDGALLSASDLAENTKLPEPTVSKVLKLLVKQDIVNSVRGINGGYSLTKCPNEINMAHIVTAIDGPVKLTACVEVEDCGPDEEVSCCDRADHCALKGQWNPLNQAMLSAFQSVSLKEMIGPGK